MHCTAFPDTPVFYDVNLRQEFYSREIVDWGLRQAQIVKMNDSEARVAVSDAVWSRND